MFDAGRGIDNRCMPKVRGESRRRLALPFVVLALAGVTSAPARADTTTVVPLNSGFTAAAGVARDATGAIWVSDGLLGICRVDPATQRPVLDNVWRGPPHA